MKKLMITIAAIAATAFALADDAQFGPSEQKVLAEVERYIALPGPKTVPLWSHVGTNAALAARIDDIMSVSTNVPYMLRWKLKPIYPKTWTVSAQAHSNEFPATYGMADLLLSGVPRLDGLVPEDMLACWRLENLVISSPMESYERNQKFVSAYLLKRARHKLRAEGKSLIPKDGVSPLQPYADRISAALNAPYFEGLQSVVDDLGIAATIRTPFLPRGAELQKLMDNVYNGDKEMSGYVKCVLLKCLGTTAYNQFVERYNAGE